MKRPLVFIHGSGDSAGIWRLQVEYFEKRWPVYAIDLPGQGQRADTLPEQPSVADYARAAHKIIQEELHLNKPVIAGHSLGGAIALEMGLEYGSELSGLILIGTGARLRVLPALLEGARNEPEKTRAQLGEIGVSEANRVTLPHQIIQEQPAGHSALYRNLAACDRFDIIPRLHEIQMPVLIICGDEDRLTPVKYSEFLHRQIAGSTIKIVGGAGHYVMREQPDEVNQTIEEWMNRGQ